MKNGCKVLFENPRGWRELPLAAKLIKFRYVPHAHHNVALGFTCDICVQEISPA
jgi:hypothetical protein